MRVDTTVVETDIQIRPPTRGLLGDGFGCYPAHEEIHDDLLRGWSRTGATVVET